jgi:hypothetical protein
MQERSEQETTSELIRRAVEELLRVEERNRFLTVDREDGLVSYINLAQVKHIDILSDEHCRIVLGKDWFFEVTSEAFIGKIREYLFPLNGEAELRPARSLTGEK